VPEGAPAQVPPVHWSLPVQELLSLQEVLSGMVQLMAFEELQVPLAQTGLVWVPEQVLPVWVQEPFAPQEVPSATLV